MKKNSITKALIIALVMSLVSSVTFAFAENDGAGTSAPGSETGQQGEDSGSQGGDGSGNNPSDHGESDVIIDNPGKNTEVDDTKSNDSKEKGKTDSEKKKNIGENNKKAREDLKKAIKMGNLSKEDEEKVWELESSIEQMEREMAALEAMLKELEDKIASLEKRAKEKKKEIAKSEKEMSERLRAMYKSGSTGFVDVVLSSESVTDVIENVDMVEHIYNSDKSNIDTLKKKYDEIIKEEKELQEAKDMQKELLSKQLETMEAQSDAILQSALVFANIDSKYSGGKLMWPVPSNHSISSKFGYRICPFHGRELHRGIDVPTYTGAPIVAAYDGVVVKSTYSSGYGYYVQIAHGGDLVTLYAHNSQLVAKVGQKVKKGEMIAKAGSTGPSTGTHCHFEVQLKGQLVDPLKLLK